MDLLKYREVESRRGEERRGEHKAASNTHCRRKARDTDACVPVPTTTEEEKLALGSMVG